MFKSFTLQLIMKAERCVGRTPAHPVWWPVAARFKSPRFFAGKPGPRVSNEHIQRPPVTTTIYVKEAKSHTALAVGGSTASIGSIFWIGYEHKQRAHAKEEAAAERYYDIKHQSRVEEGLHRIEEALKSLKSQSRVEEGLHRIEEALKSLKRDFVDLANKVDKKK